MLKSWGKKKLKWIVKTETDSISDLLVSKPKELVASFSEQLINQVVGLLFFFFLSDKIYSVCFVNCFCNPNVQFVHNTRLE